MYVSTPLILKEVYDFHEKFVTLGLVVAKGAGRHVGHKLRVGGEPGRYTRYSQVSV